MRTAAFAVAVAASLVAACRDGASVRSGPAPERAANPEAHAPRAVPGGSAAEERARGWFTDTHLVDQDGREVRFYSDLIAGRVVAIDFVFTRCQSACPLLTEKLNRIREALGPAFGTEVSFISMSVDPTYDTPQELARFARQHRAEHPAWRWITGSKEDVRRVLERLGQWVELPEQHSTEFVIGNARTRHWIKVRPDAPAEATALQLKGLVAEGAAGHDPSLARVAGD